MLIPSIVLAATLAGGAACWLIKWSDRQLHVALALSTGTFLGAVFLHLLPDIAERASADHAHAVEVAPSILAAEASSLHEPPADLVEATAGHEHSLLWLFVLAGVLAVHFVEALFLRTTEREDSSRHKNVSLVMLGGVSIHAASAGLGLSALGAGGALETSLLAAMLTHKAFEAFALVNVFLLARMTPKRIALALVLFALVTPTFMLAGGSLLAGAENSVLDAVTALAAGTFLYVCIAELLPEVFHHREDNLAKFVGLALGIAVSALLVSFGA